MEGWLEMRHTLTEDEERDRNVIWSLRIKTKHGYEFLRETKNKSIISKHII